MVVPATASIEAAAQAASKELVDPEVRGDPRMNRAVQAKLKNPHVSLSDALRIGGFQYPPRATASAVDSENVTLGQRKNQLNRRLRQARLNQAAAYERAAAAAGMSDAGSVCGSVCGSVASVGTSVTGASVGGGSVKRPASFLTSLQGNESQKRSAVASLKDTLSVLGGAHQQIQPLQALPSQSDNASVTSVINVAAPAPNTTTQQGLLAQPPQLLNQLLNIQGMQGLQQVTQVPALHTTTQNAAPAGLSAGLLQQQLAGLQTEQQQQLQQQQQQQPVLVNVAPQVQQPEAQQQQAAITQLLAGNNGQGATVAAALNNTAAVNVNNQILLIPLQQNQSSGASVAGSVAASVAGSTTLLNAINASSGASVASVPSVANNSCVSSTVHNNSGVTTAPLSAPPLSAAPAGPYTVVTNASSHVAGTVPLQAATAAVAGAAPQQGLEDDSDSDDDDDDDGNDDVVDERLEAGLQIFSREIRLLYQSAMVRAGFANEEIQSSSQSYQNFAFHAWRRECQTLQKLIRRDSSNANNNSASGAARVFGSSNQSVSSHHSNAANSHHNHGRAHV